MPTSLRREGGYSLVELIAVMTILLTVLTGLTALFIAGAESELDANRRFQANQGARIAADRLRREVHCSSGVTLNAGDGVTEGSTTAYRKVTVTLPGHCPSAVGGVTTGVVWETQLVSSNRYRLMRGTEKVADYLTKSHVFSYVNPSTAALGRLHLSFPVNLNPNESWNQWRLETDVVLRNTTRTG